MTSPSKTKFQLAVLAETPDGVDGLGEISSIEWLVCKQTGARCFDFYKCDTVVSSIDLDNARFDLQNLLGIIVVGSADTFATIRHKWSSGLPSLGIVFKRTSSWDRNSILCAAIECIVDALAVQQTHSGRAALELATYRREFERLQHSFSRLEEFVGHQSYQFPAEIFEYHPDLFTATENSGRSKVHDIPGPIGRSLIQYLPVNSSGVSSFSLYISAKPETAGQPLCVKLKAIETGQIFGEWSIVAADVRPGWIELALNYALDEPALSLVIIVEWPPDTSGWALALGPPHPYKEFCACTEAGEYLRAPIGMRIFGSLPGVRVSATTTAIRPINAPHVLAEFIPPEVCETVVQIFPAAAQDNKATLVSYAPDIGCITVHPHIGGLTVGRINVSAPKQAWGLSAQIYLAHERASMTQFGLMVCALRDESRELARLDQLDPPSPNFSGWKTLSPLETKSILAILAPAQEERLSIYLVTRQAPDVSPDFAWARFSKLEFNVLPKSLTGEKENDKLAMVAAGVAYGSKDQGIKPEE